MSDYESMTVPALEAELHERDRAIQRLRLEMSVIHTHINRKNDYYLNVERFKGMTAEEKSAFLALTQGCSLGGK